jgi:tetratricopeptide (TPR) repeat protein
MSVRADQQNHRLRLVTDEPCHDSAAAAGVAGGGLSLRGMRVAFVGRLASMARREAREAVRRAGGIPTDSVSRRTHLLVVGMHGWPLRADGSLSVKVRQAEKLRGRGEPIRIVPELAFLEALGVREGEGGAAHKTYPIEEVAGIVGVDQATIAQWGRLGLVLSSAGRYDFQDIVSLQTVASLVRRGVKPAEIHRSLSSLADFLPGTERPLAQLQIVAGEGGALLAQVGEALIAPDGQQMLPFGEGGGEGDSWRAAEVDDGGRAGAVRSHGSAAQSSGEPWHPGECGEPWHLGECGEPRVMEFRTAPAADPEGLLERAVWLEEEERYEEAAAMCRRAIAESPRRAEAYFNLGNILRMMDRARAAEEMYRMAAALDPTDSLALYNLADVLEEFAEFEEAIKALGEAVRLDPTFADAHFNLATCLEQAGRREEAAGHWRAYLRLDPSSEWARVARRRLTG